MKKILCLMLVSILMLSSTAFALCERNFSLVPPRDISTKNDLACMDFSLMNPGDNPGFDVQDSNAAIIKTTGVDGKVQSALCLTDTTPEGGYNSGSNLRKYITPTKKGIVKIELRFKYEKVTTDYMVFNFFFYGKDDVYLNRLYLSDIVSTFSLQSAGNGSFILNNGNGLVEDTWYTFTTMLNLDESTINSKLVEHGTDGNVVTYVEGFNFCPGYEPGVHPLDEVHIQTNTGDGNLIFDYIKVEKSETDRVVEFVKRDPFPLPYVPTPGPKAVEGITNVKYNGEYMYFSKAPYFEADNLYVPSRDVLLALGLDVSYENGALVGTKDGARLELTAGSSEVVFNGKPYKLTKPVTTDSRATVSLTELATIIGASSSYDAALNEYIITDMEAVQ